MSDWNILGSEIEGPSSNSKFGNGIAISDDGSRVVIGAPSDGVGFVAEGSVRPYDFGTTWSPTDAITGGEFNNSIGEAIALSSDGTKLAIGIPNQTISGEVKVFNWNGTAWVPYGTDIIGPEQLPPVPSDFGKYVDISGDGDTVLIGAPFRIVGSSVPGEAYIYILESNIWIPQATIEIGVDGARFGSGVALSADGFVAAIGASMHDGGGTERGAVFIYEQDPVMTDIWNHIDTINGEGDFDRIGDSLALSGDGSCLVIGAPLHNGTPGPDSGKIRIFKRDLSGYTLMTGGAITGENAGVMFGDSVSISGNGTVVSAGAPASVNGYVISYEWDGSTWGMIGSVLSGATLEDGFGASVALSVDGTRLAVGIPTGGGIANLGAAHVYEYSPIVPTTTAPPTSGMPPPTTLLTTTMATTTSTTLPPTTQPPTTTQGGLTDAEITAILTYWTNLLNNL
jgi:hypothetical protein